MSHQKTISDAPAYRRPDKTVASMNERAAASVETTLQHASDNTLEQLAEVVKELDEMLKRRAEQARVKTVGAVRRHPWTSVLVAAGLGAIVGLRISRRKDFHAIAEAFRNYDPSRSLKPSYAATSFPSARPISSRLEQLLDSISEIDPKAAGVPALKSAQEMFSAFKDAIRSLSQ
jgi:ElaB/YqjD/DUF883 family membrane-anchored ribosome-binding protein